MDIRQLPIAAYAPIPYEEDTRIDAQLRSPLMSHDTRTSRAHPLRHSVMNVIRAVADLRAPPLSTGSPNGIITPSSCLTPDAATPTLEGSNPLDITSASTPMSKNGAHYLLTSLTLFTTHEPCIMCSMALLHSRVREVFYLIPMQKTGGCGSISCIPGLQGVNHRFGISRWTADLAQIAEGLDIDSALDA